MSLFVNLYTYTPELSSCLISSLISSPRSYSFLCSSRIKFLMLITCPMCFHFSGSFFTSGPRPKCNPSHLSWSEPYSPDKAQLKHHLQKATLRDSLFDLMKYFAITEFTPQRNLAAFSLITSLSHCADLIFLGKYQAQNLAPNLTLGKY